MCKLVVALREHMISVVHGLILDTARDHFGTLCKLIVTLCELITMLRKLMLALCELMTALRKPSLS